MNERAEDAAPGAPDETASPPRRVLDERDRPDAERLRRTPSADDGRYEEDGAAELDAEIARRERDADGGPGLRATEFDIARLPPD